MTRNPILPYFLIAGIGILLVVVVAYAGLNQREAQQEDNQDNGEEQAADSGEENGENNGGGDTEDPEAIFENNCASCHGGDLSGGTGPDLTEVGGRLSQDEINDIITNGTDGGMPGGLVDENETEVLAEWLADMK